MKRDMGRFAIATLVCVTAVGCGAMVSDTTTSPSSGSTTTTGTPTTSSSGVFTFNMAAGMQGTDPDLIKNAIITQAAFFQTVFGRTVTQPTTITGSTTDPGCANPGASAFTGVRAMVICGANGGWTIHNNLNREKIVMHEAFHLLQFEMQWLGHPNQDQASAHWMDEGTAEYMGWRGVANAGLVTFDAARSCMVAQANQMTSSSQNLSSMETGAGFGIPGAYQLSMIGVDEIVSPAGMGSLMTYGTAISRGTLWQTAFQSAFGTSTTSFYFQYPSYRTSLGAGSDTCGT